MDSGEDGTAGSRAGDKSMTEWITYKVGTGKEEVVVKRLGENYDFCEKCQELFYGPACTTCGSPNTRIGKVEEKDNA